MARIDLVSLQQRLKQPPSPVPAKPPSGSKRPTPASAGTLHATTTMRAALPLKGANLRAERAEERARANALQAQIDELNAKMAVARAEADQALAEERQRADRLSERVGTLWAELLRAEKQTAAALDRGERAEAGRDAAEADRRRADQAEAAERARADALTVQLATAEEEAELARRHAQEAQDVAEAVRRAEDARKGRGLLARLGAAWRGE